MVELYARKFFFCFFCKKKEKRGALVLREILFLFILLVAQLPLCRQLPFLPDPISYTRAYIHKSNCTVIIIFYLL